MCQWVWTCQEMRCTSLYHCRSGVRVRPSSFVGLWRASPSSFRGLWRAAPCVLLSSLALLASKALSPFAFPFGTRHPRPQVVALPQAPPGGTPIITRHLLQPTPPGISWPAGNGSAREAAASDEDGDLVESTSPSTHLTHTVRCGSGERGDN